MTIGVVRDGAWMAAGRCRSSEVDFFAERGADVSAAKLLCAECAVRVQCLDYALRFEERFGIWGGLSERQRNMIRVPVPPPRGPVRATRWKPQTAHGVAVSALLADGAWHTLDEFAEVVFPTVDEPGTSDMWRRREARYRATVTLHNLARHGRVVHVGCWWAGAS